MGLSKGFLQAVYNSSAAATKKIFGVGDILINKLESAQAGFRGAETGTAKLKTGALYFSVIAPAVMSLMGLFAAATATAGVREAARGIAKITGHPVQKAPHV